MNPLWQLQEEADITSVTSELEFVTAYKKRVRQVVFGRRLFTYENASKKAHEDAPEDAHESAIGVSDLGCVGPHDAQPGDPVCIFFGCLVSVILRKFDATSKDYTLTGDVTFMVRWKDNTFLESVRNQS
jgi:hypothetical protein